MNCAEVNSILKRKMELHECRVLQGWVKKALKYISKEKTMSIIYQSEEKPQVQMHKQK